MNRHELVRRLNLDLEEIDLLKHPFYEAWTAGQLTREDLQNYACHYYPQIAAFPAQLSALHSRLPDGEMRRAVLRNLADEEIHGVCHSDLWLDFAEGMGMDRDIVRMLPVNPYVRDLIDILEALVVTPSTAFAALFAYEGRTPRIAGAKLKGLQEFYGADPKTCRYFDLHREADLEHSRVWIEQLETLLDREPENSRMAFAAARVVGRALWDMLDGFEHERQDRIGNTGRINRETWRN